ncbi:helix-turn-helix domain-containing protein [Candidatus Binatus sp.]|uniref:helix-turn-helix domain-containing protein n=1 Tax=Candidatus Binatus sp. TaxID=2811406 RepID=UPI003C703829
MATRDGSGLRLQLQTFLPSVSATPFVVDEETLFRYRLKQCVIAKYGSLDRFYLETDFSKGHLSQILRAQRSPSLATMTKLAKLLGVRVADFFRVP